MVQCVVRTGKLRKNAYAARKSRKQLAKVQVNNKLLTMDLCHTGPYCPGRSKKLCFTTLSLSPTVLTARLCVVKQSFFGLPGQYGRCVTKTNNKLLLYSAEDVNYFSTRKLINRHRLGEKKTVV